MIYDFYINDQLLPESFTCRDCFGDGIFWVATSILLKVFITHLEKVNMYSIGRVHSFGLTYDGTFVNATDIGQHLRSYLKLSLDHQGKCMLLEHVVDFEREIRDTESSARAVTQTLSKFQSSMMVTKKQIFRHLFTVYKRYSCRNPRPYIIVFV